MWRVSHSKDNIYHQLLSILAGACPGGGDGERASAPPRIWKEQNNKKKFCTGKVNTHNFSMKRHILIKFWNSKVFATSPWKFLDTLLMAVCVWRGGGGYRNYCLIVKHHQYSVHTNNSAILCFFDALLGTQS